MEKQPSRPTGSKASAANNNRPHSAAHHLRRKILDMPSQPHQLNSVLAKPPVLNGASNQNRGKSNLGIEFDVPTDNLVRDLRESKAANQKLSDQLRSAHVENTRLKEELTQQDDRIEKLVTTTNAHPNALPNSTYGQVISNTRKTLEKTLVVRNLKGQIRQLRVEIEELKSTQKKLEQSTKVNNVITINLERDEYFQETERLRGALELVVLDLIQAKQGAEMAKSIRSQRKQQQQQQQEGNSGLNGLVAILNSTLRGDNSSNASPRNNNNNNNNNLGPTFDQQGSSPSSKSPSKRGYDTTSLTGFSPVKPQAPTGGSSAHAVKRYAKMSADMRNVVMNRQPHNMLYQVPSTRASTAPTSNNVGFEVSDSLGPFNLNLHMSPSLDVMETETGEELLLDPPVTLDDNKKNVTDEQEGEENDNDNDLSLSGMNLEDWALKPMPYHRNNSGSNNNRPGSSAGGAGGRGQSNMGNIGATSLDLVDQDIHNGDGALALSAFILNNNENFGGFRYQGAPIESIAEENGNGSAAAESDGKSIKKKRKIQGKGSKKERKEKKKEKKEKKKAAAAAEKEKEGVKKEQEQETATSEKEETSVCSTKNELVEDTVPEAVVDIVSSSTQKLPAATAEIAKEVEEGEEERDEFPQAPSPSIIPQGALGTNTNGGRHEIRNALTHETEVTEVLHPTDTRHKIDKKKETELNTLESQSPRKTYICTNNTHVSNAVINKGDAVEALYKGGEHWFPGMVVSVINKKDSEGNSTTEYDVGFPGGHSEVLPAAKVRKFVASVLLSKPNENEAYNSSVDLPSDKNQENWKVERSRVAEEIKAELQQQMELEQKRLDTEAEKAKVLNTTAASTASPAVSSLKGSVPRPSSAMSHATSNAGQYSDDEFEFDVDQSQGSPKSSGLPSYEQATAVPNKPNGNDNANVNTNTNITKKEDAFANYLDMLSDNSDDEGNKDKDNNNSKINNTSVAEPVVTVSPTGSDHHHHHHHKHHHHSKNSDSNTAANNESVDGHGYDDDFDDE